MPEYSHATAHASVFASASVSVPASASAQASAHLYLLPHALCMSHVITHKCTNRKFVQGPREEVQGPQMCARVIYVVALAHILYLLEALATLVVALAPQ